MQMQMQARLLTHPSPELLPSTNGLGLFKVHLLDLFTSGIEICFYWLDERLTEHELVTNVQDSKQDERNIRDEEVGSVPRHKGSETLSQNDQDVEEDTVPTEERLPHCLVGQGVAGNTARGEGAHECQVGNVDASPGDEAGDTGDVDQPVEDFTARVGFVHEAEQAKGGSDGNGVVWHAAGAGAAQPLWCGALLGQTDEDTGARVDV